MTSAEAIQAERLEDPLLVFTDSRDHTQKPHRRPKGDSTLLPKLVVWDTSKRFDAYQEMRIPLLA